MKNHTKLLALAGCSLTLGAAEAINITVPADKLAFEMPSDGRVAVIDTLQAQSSGNGTIVLGTTDVGIDCSIFPLEPVTYTNIVRGLTNGGKSYTTRLKAAEWEFNGTATVSEMRALPVTVEWGGKGEIELGPEEKILGNTYEFVSRTDGPMRNDSRCLKENNCIFNTYRWCLTDKRGVTYSHVVKGRKFLSAKIDFVNCYVGEGGSALVEASKDGKNWTTIATMTTANTFAYDLPASLFPADELLIRLTGGKQGQLQVRNYACTAQLDGEPITAFGSATYREAKPNGAVIVKMEPCSLYDESYGALVPGGDAALNLWTASSGWKVPRSRCLPTNECRGVALKTAANEAEAVQLIVKPTSDLADIHVCVGDLKGPGGALLKASAMDVFRVGYVKVDVLTDSTSTRDWWPDPLLPQVGAFSVKAHENQPFWIRVKPPKGTPAGIYKGLVEIATKTADGTERTSATPMTVQVFGFELPDKMTIDTAFGTSDDWIWRFHNVKTKADREKVYAMYIKELTDHHLCPYYAFKDPDIDVRWNDIAHPLKAEPVFNWGEWDVAMEKAIKEYNLTTFQLYVTGLGWGNYEEHGEPEFMGYKGGTPEYEALISKYLGGLDQHMVEKGWDKMAFVYWYDEPNYADYPRVMKGFKTLRKYAPHLRLMLTDEPNKDLIGGPNLWCPHSCDLPSISEAEARKEGDQFWWYICTVPKAPYATEFTDHAGSELRVWLWQTWKADITGVLIWTTTWFSSNTAYPGTYQNPYVDAMCWTDSPFLAPGTHQAWGNGDGRFLYPPLALANGPKGDQPNFDKPNISLRLEILRDGIEDYEYFAMLKRLLASKPNLLPELRAQYEALLQVPASVTTSMTSFTIDPKPMEDHRYRLALALEQLSR